MPITKTEVSTSITPNIPSWVDSDTRESILDEVGRYVVTEALLDLGEGKSPVAGHGSFKKLNSEYADEEKGGDRNPNLELNGDLLAAYTWRVEMDSVSVGVFDDGQAIKAYGHNTGMKGHPWLDGKAPVRRLVPDTDESFNKRIQDGIDEIVSSFISELADQDEAFADRQAVGSENVSASTSNTFNWLDWLNDKDDE